MRVAWLGWGAVVLTACTGVVTACSGGGDDSTSVDIGDSSLPRDGSSGDDGTAGGEGGDGGAPMTPKEACIAYFTASCQRRAECGVVTDCSAQLAYCPDYLFSPGSTKTVDNVVACAQVRRTQSCEEILANIDPPCATPGTRKGGEPCSFFEQCESFSCTAFAGCGTCLALKAPGPGCPTTAQSCGQNKVCSSVDAGCVAITPPPVLATGAACPSDGGACPYEAPCAANAPSAKGTCTQRPGAGQACLYAVGGSSTATVCAYGTTCVHPQGSSAGTCTAPAQADQPCATVGCVDGLYCEADSGTCKQQIAVGSPCPTTAACADGTCVNQQPDAAAPPDRRCVAKPGGSGDACDATHPCFGALKCPDAGGTCALPPCIADAGPG